MYSKCLCLFFSVSGSHILSCVCVCASFLCFLVLLDISFSLFWSFSSTTLCVCVRACLDLSTVSRFHCLCYSSPLGTHTERNVQCMTSVCMCVSVCVCARVCTCVFFHCFKVSLFVWLDRHFSPLGTDTELNGTCMTSWQCSVCPYVCASFLCVLGRHSGNWVECRALFGRVGANT